MGPQYFAKPQNQSSGNWRPAFCLMVLHTSTNNSKQSCSNSPPSFQVKESQFQKNTTLKPQANLLYSYWYWLLSFRSPRPPMDPGKEVTLEGLVDSTQSKDLKFPNLSTFAPQPEATLFLLRGSSRSLLEAYRWDPGEPGWLWQQICAGIEERFHNSNTERVLGWNSIRPS